MKRNYGLDVLRIIAIFFVVMTHVYESAYNLSEMKPHILSISQLWSSYLGFTIGRIGVPLFLMLTGYFLLSRTWTSEKIQIFYKKNVFHLLLTWQIWIALYFLYNKYYNHIKMGGVPT